jgi:hypothetical protein
MVVVESMSRRFLHNPPKLHTPSTASLKPQEPWTTSSHLLVNVKPVYHG